MRYISHILLWARLLHPFHIGMSNEKPPQQGPNLQTTPMTLETP